MGRPANRLRMGLVIAGAVLELLGLGFVFAELAVISSHEFGVPTPWARVNARVRRWLGRGKVVQVSAAVSGASGMRARASKRPSPPAEHATDTARIAWLESYVEQVDVDLRALTKDLDRQREELVQEAARRDDELRQELAREEQERRAQLRWSVRRQRWGATLVLVGLMLGTIGNVITG